MDDDKPEDKDEPDWFILLKIVGVVVVFGILIFVAVFWLGVKP